MAIANAQIPSELSIFLKTKIAVKDKIRCHLAQACASAIACFIAKAFGDMRSAHAVGRYQ